MQPVTDFFETILGLSLQAQQLSSAQVAVRAFVVFFVLLAIMRLGKKRFLGQATAFDAILVIVIGSIASRAISGTAPFVPSLVGTAAVVLMHWVVSLLTRDMPALGSLLKGHSNLIVRDGIVNRQELKKAHMSRDDLDEDLRQQGVESPKDVKVARLERSGKLSVVKRDK
jgi:uncharacterized membrane protein YcaP (DUF421 family)